MSGSRIDVALVVSKPVIGRALRAVLADEREIAVVAEVAFPRELADYAGAIDVVLLDCDRPDFTIEESIASCASAAPRSRICVLSSQRRPEPMQRALAARADAYVVKDLTPTPLGAIVRTVAAGEYYADPRISGTLFRRRNGRPAMGALSNREGDIIRLIAAGLSNRDIGTRLSLSEKTVKNHISHIFAKLKISSRSHAAVYAVRSGLLG